jgi:hypothetical protein
MSLINICVPSVIVLSFYVHLFFTAWPVVTLYANSMELIRPKASHNICKPGMHD